MGRYRRVCLRFVVTSSIAGFALLASPLHARAADGAPDLPAAPKPADRTIDVYAVYGDGRATEGGDMHWRAYEVGFGDVLNDYLSVYVAYLNEGHPLDHHRDGFAALGSFRWPLANRWVLELSAGPYFSMDTTHVDNEARNDKRWGVRASAAMRYYVVADRFFVKVQYNHVQMLGGFNSDALLFGIGSDFGGQLHPAVSDGKTQVAVWAGTSQTNRPQVPMEKGYMVEVRRPFGTAWAYSASFVYEGNNGVAGRRGVAAQFWYVAPVGSKWTLSAGVGPYLSRDRDEASSQTRLSALLSAQVSYQVAEDWAASLRFNRVATRNDKDQDMFMVGVAHKF
ncbi:hypothetical protein ABWH74_000218 [Burkholderia vietnamiensis]|jgi:hypothetical protein|uniref:Porin n=1 Tax=Burkholderia vietnamiensis (strain G4 / LMG 22486) TaxID=269482 RepID=A4JSC8_BURVG|nr:hypothetical protein [Burkholderia vietnamiensis]ABO59181.1 conserved hypothetical protein [Burkholderia vietnamiensis G4]AOK02055.1 hypothetical protein WK23_25185 [Burkholderia vietnamiensis]AOK44535.1 hypothetical protein WL96_25545 [Burkholderia vietnamiensis]KVE32117.1 hypothetical protein WI93_27610 [Burkholderia vietnamiensis]KVE70837.1 hypothetical protein WI97_00440 [Burkholderia vietnamiensis]